MSVVVVAYDSAWPVQFEEEKARIVAAIGTYLDAIEHIGSTAVPGLGSKPVLDIQASVRNYSLIAECVPLLEGLGYEYKGEHGIPGRHFFRKPGTAVSGLERTHHLHIVSKDAALGRATWEKQVLFRDYLCAHPETAQEYYRLKSTLALQFAADRQSYTQGKTDFILNVVAQAREEDGL